MGASREAVSCPKWFRRTRLGERRCLGVAQVCCRAGLTTDIDSTETTRVAGGRGGTSMGSGVPYMWCG